jgi:hypothetical protein
LKCKTLYVIKTILKVISNTLAVVTALQNAVSGKLWMAKSFGYNNYGLVFLYGSNTGVGGTLGATMTGGNGFAFLAN